MTAKTWDYSKDFIKFREQYGDKFDKLDDMNKKAATYLLGVAREKTICKKRFKNNASC